MSFQAALVSTARDVDELLNRLLPETGSRAQRVVAAMRYSSIDFLRDRNSGEVVDGDPNQETETVEIWTFVRKPANDWLLSAIQSAA